MLLTSLGRKACRVGNAKSLHRIPSFNSSSFKLSDANKSRLYCENFGDHADVPTPLAKAPEPAVQIRFKRKKGEVPPSDRILIGPNKIPDPYYKYRDAEGRLLDKDGNEVPLNEKTAAVFEPHTTDFEKYYNENLTWDTFKNIYTMDDDRHVDNLKKIRRWRDLSLSRLGLDGYSMTAPHPDPEALKKVYDYLVNKQDFYNPTTPVIFVKGGTITDDLENRADDMLALVENRKFFAEKPDQYYVSKAKKSFFLLALALALAIVDALFFDHSDQKDKDKTYFRSRLLSAFSYTIAGVGATLLSFKLSTNYLLAARPPMSFYFMFIPIPLACWSYLLGTKYEYAKENAVGKLVFFGGLTTGAGLITAAYTLRRGPGLIRLLVPMFTSTVALSTLLAISPFDFTLKYLSPLVVLSATIVGRSLSNALFLPYKSRTRSGLAALFAYTYAGLLLSFQQPLLNRIKFQEYYFGPEAFANNAMLFLKTLTFMPMKALDSYTERRNNILRRGLTLSNDEFPTPPSSEPSELGSIDTLEGSFEGSDAVEATLKEWAKEVSLRLKE